MRTSLYNFNLLLIVLVSSIFLISGCGQYLGASKNTGLIHNEKSTSVSIEAKKSESNSFKKITNEVGKKKDSLSQKLRDDLLKRKIETVTRSSKSYDSPNTQTIKVTVAVAIARKQPGSKEIMNKYKKNTTLQAVKEKKSKGNTWYLVANKKNKEWISDEVAKVIPSPNVLLDAPLVLQLPELPRGCEVTALTMLIQQAGQKANKMELAKEIKTIPFEANGLRGNPNDGFVGNIYTFNKPGLGVYHGPIANLAKKYLGNKVVDLTGDQWKSVESQLNKGRAVWVITNSTFHRLPKNDPYWYTWKTREGLIRVTYKEHSVLVTGYGPNSVYVNDPLNGVKNMELDKNAFIAAWEQMGSQAISYN